MPYVNYVLQDSITHRFPTFMWVGGGLYGGSGGGLYGGRGCL